MKKQTEKFMAGVFFVCACLAAAAVALICLFLFGGGLPALQEIGLSNFLLGKTWKPGNDVYGILPMLAGSLCITAGAVLAGVPTGVLTAVFLAKFCPARLYRVMKPAVELLAGIPSVVYGFFGLVVLVPLSRSLFGANGGSILVAALLLGIMILPTVISVAESALRAVPESYYEGGLALGAAHERSVFCLVVPAAGRGIAAGIILGIGRALGEAMAVAMVAGNQPRMPKGLLKGARTLTSNIVMEMGYATDLHRQALIATAIVLFVLILLINLSFSVLKRRGNRV